MSMLFFSFPIVDKKEARLFCCTTIVQRCNKLVSRSSHMKVDDWRVSCCLFLGLRNKIFGHSWRWFVHSVSIYKVRHKSPYATNAFADQAWAQEDVSAKRREKNVGGKGASLFFWKEKRSKETGMGLGWRVFGVSVGVGEDGKICKDRETKGLFLFAGSPVSFSLLFSHFDTSLALPRIASSLPPSIHPASPACLAHTITFLYPSPPPSMDPPSLVLAPTSTLASTH